MVPELNADSLKERACRLIDGRERDIAGWARQLYGTPELGFCETRTSDTVASALRSLGLPVERGLALTGCRARLSGREKGPHVAVLSELDAVSVADHPDAVADPAGRYSAVHACGHNNQMAGMLGAAVALSDPLIRSRLSGTVEFLCTPAEEYIDFAFRDRLRKEGKIEFFSGKQELVRLGYFDDVDLCMMFHSLDLGDDAVMLDVRSNGFIAKQATFLGRPSHAGSAPEKGINALNAAALAIMNIHAQRETFRDEDHVRVHPIITKEDVVNVVPSDVRMDAYVRAASVAAMQDANAKVNRALRAGSDAVGAQVRIKDRAGYLPIRDCPDFYALFGRNVGTLGYGDRIMSGEQFSGSFDFGDISYLKPSIHPMVGGVSGALHAPDFRLTDINRAVVLPAKAMAMTVIDLLGDGAREARRIVDSCPPAMTKEQYLSYLRSFSG